MDAGKMGISAIHEGIARGGYLITGILETGEITVAIMGEPERTLLGDCTDAERMERFRETRGRPALEYISVIKQNCCGDAERNSRNGLRIRRIKGGNDSSEKTMCIRISKSALECLTLQSLIDGALVEWNRQLGMDRLPPVKKVHFEFTHDTEQTEQEPNRDVEVWSTLE